MKNIYTTALLKHPIFQDRKLKSDEDIKKIFDFNAKLIQEFIIREGLNEYNWDENDEDVDGHSRTDQKNENDKKNEDEDYEEENEKNYTNEKGKHIIEESNDSENELDFDDLQIQYSLLLLIGRLYKVTEHIILKFYLYHIDRSGLNNIDNINFLDAILFLKKKNIIIKEDEEQSIYLLKQLVEANEEDFIYENSLEIEYSFLSEDLFMTNNISIDFLSETIDNLKIIVQKIYSI